MNITQNLIVACKDNKGQSAIFVAKEVVVTNEQYKEGLHLLYAKLKAQTAGYFEPFIVFSPESFSSIDAAVKTASNDSSPGSSS